MRKINKSIVQISSTLGLILTIGTLHAAECTQAPDCANLGYTKTASDCSGMASIKCPFDTSKVFCDEKTAKACDKIGDIAYSDGTCVVKLSKLDPLRQAIGVVVNVSPLTVISFDENSSINWNDAKSYCDNYSAHGLTDWRVPDSSELTIIYSNTTNLNNVQGSLYQLGKTIFTGKYWDSFFTVEKEQTGMYPHGGYVDFANKRANHERVEKLNKLRCAISL